MREIGTSTIYTQRLCLRNPKISDAAELFSADILGDTLEEAENAVSNMIRYNDDPLNFHWVLEYQGNAIGRIKAWEVNTRDNYAQLGYDIGKKYRCKGLMTEAVRAVIRYLLTEVSFNRVYCMVRESNKPSIRICEKANMIYEGTMRKHFIETDGTYSDVLVFGILSSEL